MAKNQPAQAEQVTADAAPQDSAPAVETVAQETVEAEVAAPVKVTVAGTRSKGRPANEVVYEVPQPNKSVTTVVSYQPSSN